MPNMAAAYYYRGVCYKFLNNTDGAKKDLLQASKLDPSRPEILIELAEVYEMEFQYDEAQKIYNRALKKDPLFVTTYFNLANLSVRLHEFSKAEKYYNTCITLDSRFAKAYVNLGITKYSADKNAEKSIAYYTKALTADSTFQPALFWRGMMYTNIKKPLQALQDWNKLIAYNPESPLLVLVRALIYLELENYDRAFTDLKKIISKHYEDENLFRGQRSILDKQLDLQFAVSYLTRTIYGIDDAAGSLIKKGFCFLVMGNNDKALTEFKKSNKLQPSSISFFMTALAYDHTDDADSAFIFYDKALQYDNDIFDAHKKRGIHYSVIKNWRAAYTDFEAMRKLEPGLVITYRLRGLIQMQFKDYYGSILDFTKYLKADSTDYEIWMSRAFCERSVKDIPNANKDYRKALLLQHKRYDLYEAVIETDLLTNDTTHALQTINASKRGFVVKQDLLLTQAKIYLLQHKTDSAKQVLLEMTKNPNLFFHPYDYKQSVVYFLDAWIDFAEQHYKKALKKVNKSIELQNDNQDVRYLRCKIFIATGQSDKAIADLELLVARNYQGADAMLQTIPSKQVVK